MSQEIEKKVHIFPPSESIFAAFNFFNVQYTKVVIVGQDCYHTPGVACGLAFGTKPGVTVPPSLRNIYKEIKRDYPDYVNTKDGDISHWARGGILLLNTALTVRKGEAASHSAIWKGFADYIIQYISKNAKNVIFLLWGNHAKSKIILIDNQKHKILFSGHPSPLSVRFFENCGHFKATNEYLISIGLEPVAW